MSEKKYQVPADHAVLSVRDHAFRVSSDHAWLDSGTGFLVECWDRTNLKTVTLKVRTGWEGSWVEKPDVDATEDDRRLARAYDTARSYVAKVYATAERAHYIEQGTVVEVVRGRKAPKGRYEVSAHRQGNYGPCVNLRTKDGKFINYVSVENVRVVPDYARVFSGESRSPEYVALITKVAEEGFTPTAWGILADWCEEHNRVWGGANGGVTAEDFAYALRRITSGPDAPKLSTYYADCHNEFRRPFAGV